MKRVVFILLALAFFDTHSATAFTVIRNVNSDPPPVPKTTIFDQAHPNPALSVSGTGNAPASVGASGSLEAQITGSDKAVIALGMKPPPGSPATFDATTYDYLLLTCRVEGNQHHTDPAGKSSDQRPNDIHMLLVLTDAHGLWLKPVDLADLSTDNKTPAQTVTLIVPMTVFTQGATADAHHIQTVGFYLPKVGPDLNRNYHLVVDRIALFE